MKKALILSMVAIMSVSTLVSCGNKNQDTHQTKDIINESTSDEPEIKEPVEGSQDNVNNNKDELVESKPDEDKTENKEITGKIVYHESYTGNNYYLPKKLSGSTEKKVSQIVESLKSLPRTDYLEEIRYQQFSAFPSDTNVKGVEKKGSTITVDFDRDFSVGLGSSSEIAVLESLVNSIGANLGVTDVIITVNGSNYSSGHIIMKDNESFKVNNKKPIELKELER